MLTRIMRKVPYFKGEVDAFQLNSKNAMYRPSCIGWLGQWATPVDDGYKDQILPPLPTFQIFVDKLDTYRLRYKSSAAGAIRNVVGIESSKEP
jgi:hypothetical protein